MPRGPVGGATAALIHALAERGVHVSAYQIERWRAAGDLERPRRHGLGRGRGVVSDSPDEATVQRALLLASSSRRGSRRFGTHPIERLALGLPVPEPAVRAAIERTLDEIARMTGADIDDEDAGWQTRQNVAARAARDPLPASWQDLVDAVDGTPEPPELPRARKRTAVAGAIHAIGGGSEALAEDLIEMLRLVVDLSADTISDLLRAQQAAQLRGEDLWGRVAQQLSIHHLRQVAAAAGTDDLGRAVKVIMDVTAMQGLVVMLGVLDLAGNRLILGIISIGSTLRWSASCRLIRCGRKPEGRC